MSKTLSFCKHGFFIHVGVWVVSFNGQFFAKMQRSGEMPTFVPKPGQSMAYAARWKDNGVSPSFATKEEAQAYGEMRVKEEFGVA